MMMRVANCLVHSAVHVIVLVSWSCLLHIFLEIFACASSYSLIVIASCCWFDRPFLVNWKLRSFVVAFARIRQFFSPFILTLASSSKTGWDGAMCFGRCINNFFSVLLPCHSRLSHSEANNWLHSNTCTSSCLPSSFAGTKERARDERRAVWVKISKSRRSITYNRKRDSEVREKEGGRENEWNEMKLLCNPQKT